jgi:hypothetical protein
MEPEGPLQCSQEHATCPYLSEMNPIHVLQPYFPKNHFNISLASTPMSSEWSLPKRISNQNSVRNS